jgi:serine/threonine-protein kinase HipA
MKRGRGEAILAEVLDAVKKWPDYAEQAEVTTDWRKQIRQNLRLDLPAK